MRAALDRFRRRVLWGFFPLPDVVLACALCVIAVASVLTGNPAEGPLPIVLPVAVASALSLSARRRAPVVAIAVIAAAGLAQTMLAQTPGSLWSLVVHVIAMYSLAAWSTELVAAIAGALFVAALLLEERIAAGVDYVFILLLFGGVWLLGRASRSWRGRIGQAEKRERDATRLATAEERLRIARELHDVVAHSLGAIAVQADAAEAALRSAPERALGPVQAISRTAREALTEIRDVLDVLRGDEAPPGSPHRTEPQQTDGDSPGLPGIRRLVKSARESGLRVRLDMRLVEAQIPSGVARACYRIVQESLSNIRTHAPGAAADVTIVQEPRRLVLRVSDDAGPAAPSALSALSTRERAGYGIRGMQERVDALGGRLHAGRTSRGFEVTATLPLPPDTGPLPDPAGRTGEGAP